MSRGSILTDLTSSGRAAQTHGMAAKKEPARDEIDEQLDIWVREIPDLDRLTEGIIERIGSGYHARELAAGASEVHALHRAFVAAFPDGDA